MSKAGILIVEDSFIVAFHLQKTLETEGYTVIGTETSGETALTLLEKQRPDLILMDIMLNGRLDGIETARTIKSRYNLPIIYITALTDKETIQRAKITEPFGFLTKPFEDREVFTVVEMALYKHNIESKLRQSEEKYFATVKSISDAVVIIDQEHRITYMNPRAEAITEWVLSDAQGKSLPNIFLLKNLATEEFPINPLQCDLSQGRVNSLPPGLTLMSRTGVERPIGEGSMSPVINERGKFIGLVIIFKDLSDKVAHEKLLKEFEKKHLAALMEGQEQERSRIARDLHDGLGQMLNALKMNVNLLGQNDPKMNSLYHLIDEAIQESIRISENLLPSKLKDFDLATCLRSLCNTISKTSPTPVSFESFGNARYIEQAQKINFYRIAQEAINNALKHGGAASISVQLNEDQDKIELTIEDDGKGFKKDLSYDQSEHHGLVNMKERAEIMGGKLTIESDGERGTLIIVEAPVNKNKMEYAKA
jgi:PAS domain S-box-containing protein